MAKKKKSTPTSSLAKLGTIDEKCGGAESPEYYGDPKYNPPGHNKFRK